MESIYNFLNCDMAYLITYIFFREAKAFQIYSIFQVQSGRTTGHFNFVLQLLQDILNYIIINWHCHGFNWESLHKCFPVLPKIRKCSLVLTIWLKEQRKPFVSEKSMTGWPECTYMIQYWGTPPATTISSNLQVPTNITKNIPHWWAVK